MVKLLGAILISLLLTGCSSARTEQTTPIESLPATVAQSPTTAQSLPLSAKIVVNKTTVQLEAANTPREQEIGLMFRKSMPIDRGMVFNFPKAMPANFWMKNTLISLDIIFLRDNKIVNIQANVPPCKADPCPGYGPASSVLVDRVIELNAGQAKKFGLKVGDKLEVQPLKIPTSSPVASPTVQKRQ
jgi:uncharacterized protein